MIDRNYITPGESVSIFLVQLVTSFHQVTFSVVFSFQPFPSDPISPSSYSTGHVTSSLFSIFSSFHTHFPTTFLAHTCPEKLLPSLSSPIDMPYTSYFIMLINNNFHQRRQLWQVYLTSCGILSTRRSQRTRRRGGAVSARGPRRGRAQDYGMHLSIARAAWLQPHRLTMPVRRPRTLAWRRGRKEIQGTSSALPSYGLSDRISLGSVNFYLFYPSLMTQYLQPMLPFDYNLKRYP